jgi:hypothetical protein
MSRPYITRLQPNRGSDVDFTIVWKDSANEPADLHDYTVAAMDVTTGLEDYLTLEITDEANGVITGRIEWNDSLLAGINYRFRVQVSIDEDQDATNLIEVTYQ